MQTATTITTTTRATLGQTTPSTITAMEQSPLTSPTRTQTRPMKSGRLPPKAATSQSSETGKEEEEESLILLTIPTTWEGEEGAAEGEVWLSVSRQEKSPQLIKEASQASVLAWSDRTAGSTLEEQELEGEEEAHEAHLVVAPAGLVTEVETVGRSVATGPPPKIGSDGIFQNISDEPHRH